VTSPPPAPDPASAAMVAVQLSMDPADEVVLAKLGPTVAAINVFVRRVRDPLPDGSWAADVQLGAAMLGARLWKRRGSVEGVATFTAEGAVYVQRNDPDVAMLLRLGVYAPPVVG
jgi:hypothetical protein